MITFDSNDGIELRAVECNECSRDFFEFALRSPFRIKQCPYCDNTVNKKGFKKTYIGKVRLM